MKQPIVALVLVLGLAHTQPAGGQNRAGVVLPSPTLLRCRASNCSQMWSETAETKGVFPKQLIVDFDDGCVYGFTALYDKSVPIDQIKSAIDQVYGESALKLAEPLHVWRVESQKFAIQLGVASTKDEKRSIAEAGTRQVIFIAFGGRSACRTPGQ